MALKSPLNQPNIGKLCDIIFNNDVETKSQKNHNHKQDITKKIRILKRSNASKLKVRSAKTGSKFISPSSLNPGCASEYHTEYPAQSMYTVSLTCTAPALPVSAFPCYSYCGLENLTYTPPHIWSSVIPRPIFNGTIAPVPITMACPTNLITNLQPYPIIPVAHPIITEPILTATPIIDISGVHSLSYGSIITYAEPLVPSILETDQNVNHQGIPLNTELTVQDIHETEDTCQTLIEVPENYNINKNTYEENQIQSLDCYLTLPKHLFPTARMMIIDPNSVIDEVCKLNNISEHVPWILDLEFGIPKIPVTRPIAAYDAQYNSICCKNVPGAIHPKFEICTQEFKTVILFYYDCVVSVWYRSYTSLNQDGSVVNFQSWLRHPMQALGMCWP